MQIADYPSFLKIVTGMSLTTLASVLFKFLLTTGGLAALIAIILGGVKQLTSAGDPAKIKDAKKQIFAAVLGLIILFSSWMILNSINPNLVNIAEPTSLPAPLIITPPTQPVKPPASTPAAFYYVPLGQVIDDLVKQEKEAMPKIRDFANAAKECSHDQCSGGTFQCWVSVPCPPAGGGGGGGGGGEGGGTGGGEGGSGSGGSSFDWSSWLHALKTPTAYAASDCGYPMICSAPCNTGDPCASNKNELIDKVLTVTDQMKEEVTKLQQAKSELGKCVLREDAVLLSCQEALDIFNPGGGETPTAQWDKIKNCHQGYDFYCMYGSDNDAYLDEITLPLETISEGVKAARELEDVVSKCSCSSCGACCKCCAPCSGTPCPALTYNALAASKEAVDKLETRLKKFEETITEIMFMSAADEITTLTCSEAYSWLKSIKESGCPKSKTFPCCPIDEETEKTIRSCQLVDFFFCSAP